MLQKLHFLIPQAVSRSKITREVEALQIVTLANTFFRDLLPPGHTEDVQAVSFAQGILTVYGKHRAALALAHEETQALQEHLQRHKPELPCTAIRIRLRSETFSR